MNVYISFYRNAATEQVIRKQIHITTDPAKLFHQMNSCAYKEPYWVFWGYQVDCAKHELGILYDNFFDTDKPPVIEGEWMNCDKGHSSSSWKLKNMVR